MELRMCICVFVHISVMCIYTYKIFKQQQKLLFIDYLFNAYLRGLNVSTNNLNLKTKFIFGFTMLLGTFEYEKPP